MTKQIIGLDFGSTAFRAVLLEEGRSGNGFRLVDYYESTPSPLPPENRPDPILSSRDPAKELLGREAWRTVSHSSVIPGEVITRRILEFPFQDKAKLESVLPFELETMIADPIEDLVIDFQMIEQDEQGSRLFAVAAERQRIAEHLQSLDSIGVDPALVDDEVLALAGLLHLLDPVDRSNFGAIVDIGARKTKILIFAHDRVQMARVFGVAGDHLTQVIAEDQGIPWEEAEAAKVGDREETSEKIISRAWDPLVRDIGLTLEATRRKQGEPIRTLYLCGRGSLTRNLPEHLSSRLGIPCERIRIQGGLSLPRALASDFDCAAASAVGLALRGIDSEEQIRRPVNFRKGEFAYRSRIEAARSRLIQLGAMLALIAVLALARFVSGYFHLRSEDRALTDQIRGLFFTTFPAAKQVPLGYELHEMKTRLTTTGGNGSLGAGSVAVVDMLREISQRVPEGISVDVREFIFDPDKIRVRGRTDSFETVDRIKTELVQFPSFSGIEVTDAKVSVDQQGVDFTLMIHLGREE